MCCRCHLVSAIILKCSLVNDGFSESGNCKIPNCSTTPPNRAKHFFDQDTLEFPVMSTVLNASQSNGNILATGEFINGAVG